jgi:hypothetical protein
LLSLEEFKTFYFPLKISTFQEDYWKAVLTVLQVSPIFHVVSQESQDEGNCQVMGRSSYCKVVFFLKDFDWQTMLVRTSAELQATTQTIAGPCIFVVSG